MAPPIDVTVLDELNFAILEQLTGIMLNKTCHTLKLCTSDI